MSDFEITKAPQSSVFRKVALGSWWTAGDPSVYGILEIEMTEALRFLEEQNQTHSTKLTVTHLVGWALAETLKIRPEVNSVLRWGQIYRRKNVDLFFQVNIPGLGPERTGQATLSGTLIRRVDQKSIVQLAEELNEKTARTKSGQDLEFGKTFRTLSQVPQPLMKWVLLLSSFLSYDLKLPLHILGVPTDPFGSAMITNVGALTGQNDGVDVAFAPLVPYTRCPMLLAVGSVQKRPWVRNDTVVVAPVLRIGVTFDHRLMDGVHAAEMVKVFKSRMMNPRSFLK
ncbi:MAG: 2-oxo acid dehydrogenase subunit E2 [Proteobacteria bacterium]|nr:2-oxo acid dehydrogenase subunit E2 [Pseudomonadota bacterium]